MEKSEEILGLSVEELGDLRRVVDAFRAHPGRKIAVAFRLRLDKLSVRLRKELFLNMPRADYDAAFGKGVDNDD